MKLDQEIALDLLARTMKPKYEIGQEVYYHDRKTLVIGIKKGSSTVPFLYLIDEDDDLWISESLLKLDNKKYYILYRSADGLEVKEHISSSPIAKKGFLSSRSMGLKNISPRLYICSDIQEDHEKQTLTYIYDEVI